MKKRLISLLLVFSMLLTLLPASVFATGSQGQQVLTSVSASVSSNPFTDVKESDWFYDAVQYAQANGFFSGTSETTFAPGMTMTRGMFVTVLAKMAGVDGKNYAGKSTFTDVPRDAYYEPYVAWASEHGVTSGIGGGKFAPDVLINREQMATFFVGYFEKFGVDYDTGANITTIPGDLDQVSSWAQDSVLKLWKQGLLVGDGKSFNPSGSASRAEAAALCRSADKAVDTWYSEPGVPSGRISVDPATGEGMKPVTPEQPSGGDSSGSSSGGTTITDYYQVNFALGSGQNIADVKLPDNKLYAKGTKVDVTEEIILTISKGPKKTEDPTERPTVKPTEPPEEPPTEKPTETPTEAPREVTKTVILELPTDKTEDYVISLILNGVPVMEPTSITAGTATYEITLTGSGTVEYELRINDSYFKMIKVVFS